MTDVDAYRLVIPVDDIEVGERDRLEMGDLTALADSIRTVGLLHPVVITADFQLVAGDRRLAAVRDLGWREVPVTIVDLSTAADVLRAEQDENSCRKALTPAEAERAYARRKTVLAPLAAARQAHGQTAAGRPMPDAPADSATASAGETRQTAAIGTGFSHATMDKVSAIREIAETGLVRSGERTSPAAAPVREAAQDAMAKLEQPGASVEGLHRAVAQAIAENDDRVRRDRDKAAWRAALLGAKPFREFDMATLPALLGEQEWDAAGLVVEQLAAQVEAFRSTRPSHLRVVGDGVS